MFNGNYQFYLFQYLLRTVDLRFSNDICLEIDLAEGFAILLLMRLDATHLLDIEELETDLIEFTSSWP